MSVIKRKKRDTAFTIIDTSVLRRQDLSLKAKGLLTLMMSFPEDWEFTMLQLANNTQEGREALQNTMKELMEKGYVTRQKKRNETNQFTGWEYEVDDTPRPPTPPSDGDADKRESRQSGMPTVGKPATTNKESTNKEKRNKNIHPEQSLSPDGDAAPPGLTAPQKRCQRVIDAWNQNRGKLPKANLTPDREKTVERLIKTYGLSELETLVGKATQFVAIQDFWLQNKYGFDNLLSKAKFVQHAESFDAMNPESNFEGSAAPETLAVGQSVQNLQGKQGTIQEIRGDKVQVLVGTVLMTWPVKAVRAV